MVWKQISKSKWCLWKDYIHNPATCTCENSKYVGSIIDGWVITCDEFIKVTKSASTKTVLTNSTSRKTAPAKAVPTKTLLIKVFQNFFSTFY